MIKRLIQEVRLGTTVRSCAEEFGPTPGTRYAAEWADLTDAEMIRHERSTLIAYAEAKRTGSATAWNRFEDHIAAEQLHAALTA